MFPGNFISDALVGCRHNLKTKRYIPSTPFTIYKKLVHLSS